jgi:hypothetical protein
MITTIVPDFSKTGNRQCEHILLTSCEISADLEEFQNIPELIELSSVNKASMVHISSCSNTGAW